MPGFIEPEPSESFGDPEKAFEDPEAFEEEPVEIEDDERDALEQDLADVRILKSILTSRSIRGIVVFCSDCDDDHYLSWGLMAGNLEGILRTGRSPVHEPAFQPNPDEYITWDYARGFLDGFETYPFESSGGHPCGFCSAAIPEGRWRHCPTCGKDLALLGLISQLKTKGWGSSEINDLLEASGFDPPIYGAEDASES